MYGSGLTQRMRTFVLTLHTAWQVRNATPACLDALIVAVDPSALVHPVANCALYAANPKARLHT